MIIRVREDREADTTRYTTSVHGDQAEVYHPSGDDALPLVLLLHGSHCSPEHYTRFAQGLAGEGFAVLVPAHRRVLFGELAYYPQQAQANWALEWAAAERERVGSPLAGRLVLEDYFLAGHSFGGAVVLAVASDVAMAGLQVEPAQLPPQLRAAIVFGTHNVPPRGTEPRPVPTKVPLAFVQGDLDGTVRPEEAAATFELVALRPKLYVALSGANHYAVTNDDDPLGANSDHANRATLRQATAVASCVRWAARWFTAHRAGVAGERAAQALRAGAGLDEPHASVRFVEELGS